MVQLIAVYPVRIERMSMSSIHDFLFSLQFIQLGLKEIR